MTAEPQERAGGLRSNQIVKYPAGVRELLIYVVNDLGVRHRAIDGNHMLLYPPDGVSRPFKVAASRAQVSQIKYINEQFLDRYGLPRMEAKPEVKQFTTAATPPPALDGTETDQSSVSLPPELAEPGPTNPPSEPSEAPEPDSVQPAVVLRPVSVGRKRVLHSRTEEPLPFETDGDSYWCLADGCDWCGETRTSLGGHSKKHLDSDESKRLRATNSGIAKTQNAQLVKVMRSVTNELLDALGLTIADDQQAVIDSLATELAAAKKEVSDLRAKIDLMKEALGA